MFLKSSSSMDSVKNVLYDVSFILQWVSSGDVYKRQPDRQIYMVDVWNWNVALEKKQNWMYHIQISLLPSLGYKDWAGWVMSWEWKKDYGTAKKKQGHRGGMWPRERPKSQWKLAFLDSIRYLNMSIIHSQGQDTWTTVVEQAKVNYMCLLCQWRRMLLIYGIVISGSIQQAII